jgi:bifunctional non-homologous end joining protein LigD
MSAYKPEQEFRFLYKQVRLAATSPFWRRVKDEAVTTWVKPKLVAEVKFTEWTAEGEMRHPAYLGLREDKRPEHMVRETESSRKLHAKHGNP